MTRESCIKITILVCGWYHAISRKSKCPYFLPVLYIFPIMQFALAAICNNCHSLTHWGRVTHICVSKLTIIGSDNGLSSPDGRQAIVWTNDGLLLIGPLGTNFSEILMEILTFSFKKMRLKVSSAKRRPFCLGLNVLTHPQAECSTVQVGVFSVVPQAVMMTTQVPPRFFPVYGIFTYTAPMDEDDGVEQLTAGMACLCYVLRGCASGLR